MYILKILAHIFICHRKNYWLNNNNYEIYTIYILNKASYLYWLLCNLTLVNIVRCFILNLLHISLRHANHNKIGKNIKEEYWETDKEYERYIGIDKWWKLLSYSTKIRVINKLINGKQGISYIVKIHNVKMRLKLKQFLIRKIWTSLIIRTIISIWSAISIKHYSSIDTLLTSIIVWSWKKSHAGKRIK